jgi:formate C-acetyltransferase
MGVVTLADPALRGVDLAALPRLARLRRKLLDAKPAVCIERARHVTRTLREAPAGEPFVVTYARAVRAFLAAKAPRFPDESLLAGTTTSKEVGAPVYPELTGLTIWPELDTIGSRDRNPLALDRGDARELAHEIFPWWAERNVLERARRRLADPRGMAVFQRLVFFLAGKAGAVSHTVPHYAGVLARGVDDLAAEAAAGERAADAAGDRDRAAFYRAVGIALGGVTAYAANLAAEARRLAAAEADPARSGELRALAAVCERVPAKPPRTFREAVNALWILQVAVHAESINMAMSPGRLDQVLFPWYRADVEAGRLRPGDAVELVGCLWLKLKDNVNLVPEASDELFGGAGTVPAVTVGGVDAAGADAVNDLSYVMLRATELLATRDPSVNARFHPDVNPRAWRDRVAEVVATTRAVPAFHNDAAVIRALERQGVATGHARDWAVIGCVEPGAAGRSYDCPSAVILNLASALELALYDGRRPATGDEVITEPTGYASAFRNFGEIRVAFEGQVRWLVYRSA